MKTKLLFLLLSLVTTSSIKGQNVFTDYHPFIEEGKVWVTVQDIPNQPYWGSYFRIDYFDGDTIVGNKPCKRWVQKYIRKNGAFMDTTPDRVNEFVFTVIAYEEDRQVWFFFDGEDKPRLWFDFGAEVGDVFSTTVPYAVFPKAFGLKVLQQEEFTYMFHDSVKILGREEQFIGGRMQNVISFHTTRMEGDEFNKFLMEGIGSTYSCDWTMLYPYGNSAWPYPNARLCLCTINDQTLYVDQEMIDLYPVITSLYTTTSLSALRPNQRDSTNLKKFDNQSWYDLSGRRLNTSHPNRGGLYIIDGKKVVVK